MCPTQATSSIIFWPSGGAVSYGSQGTPRPRGELTQREEALAAWEEKARISKKALAQVSASLDKDQIKGEAIRHEYLDQLVEHIAHGRQVLNFDKMLGE
jgi:hypothetical protein